jgi:hypothetical protein
MFLADKKPFEIGNPNLFFVLSSVLPQIFGSTTTHV